MRWELPGEIRVEQAQKAGGGAECGGPLSMAGAMLQGKEHGRGRLTEGKEHGRGGSRRGRLTWGKAHLGEGSQRGRHTLASETSVHHTCISEALDRQKTRFNSLVWGPNVPWKPRGRLST